MEIVKAFVLLFLLLLCSCAGIQKSELMYLSSGSDNSRQVEDEIREVLCRQGEKIDYDSLLWVHREMGRNNALMLNSGELLNMLIKKTNDHPRVDNMILICAAEIIGSSQSAIDDVDDLFRDILMQDHRLNTWVLTYIGDAIGRYKYDMPEGDFLADLLEKRVAEHTSNTTLSKEYFGFHFLPPPKEEYIIDYIAGIEDQETRVLERNCYYSLIKSEWSEVQIAEALRRIQSQGIPGAAEKTQRPLKYIILHPDQFEGPISTLE